MRSSGVSPALLLVLAACSLPWARNEADTTGRPLPVPTLQPGISTRAEVLALLGPPQLEFSRDRVLMWRVLDDDGACVPVGRSRSRQDGDYTFVVEFDGGGRVRRWSVVEQTP